MKYLKVLILALVATFAFGKSDAQVRVGVRLGGGHPYYHHRHHYYHRNVVVVRHHRRW